MRLFHVSRRMRRVFPHATMFFLGTIVGLGLAGCASGGASVPSFPVHIVNLGKIVNSPDDDFAPTITANGGTLFFTSNRRQGGSGRSDFYSTGFDGSFWSESVNAGSPVNSGANQGASSVSADGQTLYFASCNREGGPGSCDLYVTERQGRDWRTPRVLGPPVSTDAWESQPSISPDGSILFFVSDRGGGFGGLDIWQARRGEDGSWGQVHNAGPTINTGGDEVTPFIAADGATLYFSSDGHGGAGGTDIFVTRFDGKAWSPPVNMGTPINSERDDEFCTLSAEGSTLYIASRREEGQGGLDLYSATPNPYPPGIVTLVHGTVKDRYTARPLEAKVEVRSGDQYRLLSSYVSNALTGEFLCILPVGGLCQLRIAADGYEDSLTVFDFRKQAQFHSIRLDAKLRNMADRGALEASLTTNIPGAGWTLFGAEAVRSGLVVEEVVTSTTLPVLPYVFFDAGSAELPSRYQRRSLNQGPAFLRSSLPRSALECYWHVLDITGSLLRDHPDLHATLVGTLDRAEQSGSRVELAEARAGTVARYLREVWGIAPQRITVHGRTLPDLPSSSTTEEGREENRRVEIQLSQPELLTLAFHDTISTLTPPVVQFYPASHAVSGIASWVLQVHRDTTLVFQRKGSGPHPDSLEWTWGDAALLRAREGGFVKFSFTVGDGSGRSLTTVDSSRVQVLTLEKKQEEHLRDVSVERLSLILFDFDKAEVPARNTSLLRKAAQRILPTSSVVIRGSTDALGAEEYNEALSLRRATSVRDRLVANQVKASMRIEGTGERELPYRVDLPEGRFYCRTVHLFIETPR